MKIDNVPGEFAFKALYLFESEWKLTIGYFFSFDEAKTRCGTDEIKWPVEVHEDGTIYVPAEEEL